MRPWSNRSGSSTWLDSDDIAIYLLVIANVLVFAWCVARAMPGPLNATVLLQAGALYPLALSGGERWRLVAHGFLHLNALHLAVNMLCLVGFGGPLIRRVKALHFLLIYLVAVIAGGIASIYGHDGPFLSVGASGGIAGLLGALTGLWLLGKAAVPPSFLAVNIGLNVVLSASVANIDWASHLGGFAGGLMACAVLDVVAKLSGRLLQCKFPEFIKVNGAALLAAPAIAVLAVGVRPPSLGTPADAVVLGIGYVVVCLGLIKLTDLMLPVRKGLALAILALALGNAALAWALGTAYQPALAQACWHAIIPLPYSSTIDLLCEHPGWTAVGLAAAVFVLTLLIYSWDLRRGLNDVGFIGATLKAERRRSNGL